MAHIIYVIALVSISSVDPLEYTVSLAGRDGGLRFDNPADCQRAMAEYHVPPDFGGCVPVLIEPSPTVAPNTR